MYKWLSIISLIIFLLAIGWIWHMMAVGIGMPLWAFYGCLAILGGVSFLTVKYND